MKLDFESDIPAFSGRSKLERVTLRRFALKKDPWIYLALFASCACAQTVASATCFAMVYFGHEHSGSVWFWTVLIVAYLGVAFPLTLYFDRYWVMPRVRRALEGYEQPAA